MALSPLRLTFTPSGREPRSAILTGLDSSGSSAVPDWIKAHLGVETWIGSGLSIGTLREAAAQMQSKDRADDDAIPWISRDDTTLEIDLMFPLLVLARDLSDLGEVGELTLGGA